MRWETARCRDGFGLFFVTALLGWCGASRLVTGTYQIGAGAIVAGVLAIGCALWLRLAIRRRDEARIRAIITTPQEFPAIPMPDYLLPYVAERCEMDLAAG